jgi:hypothetical protein
MKKMPLMRSILLLCLVIISQGFAFRGVSHVRNHHISSIQMCSSALDKGAMQRKIKSAVAAVVIAASSVDLSFAAGDTPSPITRSVLEQSIQTLEASNTRSEVIQSLADVFEAAGTKTLLVRTKYKYVSKRARPA